MSSPRSDRLERAETASLWLARIRPTAVLLVVGVLAACGSGAPGGFPGARRSGSLPNPSRAEAPPGTPITAPVSSRGAGEQQVAVTLTRNRLTPQVAEVEASLIVFVVANDDDVPLSFTVSPPGGATLVGVDVPEGAVRTLRVQLAPGSYTLSSRGTDRAAAAARFRVT